MKILKHLDNYLYDREYKIIIKENYVNIINYDEIIDFSSNNILVSSKSKRINIEGTNLAISKMIDDEVLVTGNILIVSII